MTESFVIFSQALRELLARPGARQRFLELETSQDVIEELGITGEMATELKIVLARLPDGGEAEAPAAAAAEPEDKAMKKTVTSAEDFLEHSFAQLRTGAMVLMVMSITMFLLGVGFLVIAAVRTFTHPESAGVTGVIAGIGVVQIAVLFYRNPLRDIGRSIANAQQSKIVVMSYMIGMGLIAKSLQGTTTDKEQQALSTFTQQALDQFKRFTDGKLERTDQPPALPRPGHTQ